MIPVNFMRRMNTFKLEIDGVEIQVKFVEEETLLDEGLEQLLEILESTKYPILGFDIKSPICCLCFTLKIFVYWFHWIVPSFILYYLRVSLLEAISAVWELKYPRNIRSWSKSTVRVILCWRKRQVCS